ncbi:hypothetical protein BJ165DRAFT_1516942 [Panaeolus papilionaceus]|nr:hypothetical protein BJ165DRAFT_1516942 [Panaeolus papilionaceus]
MVLPRLYATLVQESRPKSLQTDTSLGPSLPSVTQPQLTTRRRRSMAKCCAWIWSCSHWRVQDFDIQVKRRRRIYCAGYATHPSLYLVVPRGHVSEKRGRRPVPRAGTLDDAATGLFFVSGNRECGCKAEVSPCINLCSNLNIVFALSTLCYTVDDN